MRHLASSSSSSSSLFRRKSPIVLARSALIAGAISTILLLFWISSTTSGHDHSGDPSFLSRDRKDGNFQEDGKDREDRSGVLSFLSRDRKDGNFQEDGQDREDEEVERERDGGEGEIRTEQQRSCATVEEMGKGFASGSEKESLRARELIKRHFEINGFARVRGLPPQEFCRQGFVIGKASEAGFGNEMYKILTAAALSVILNRSLIIGQNRGLYPFGDYISYSSVAFTLKEVKHLWRKNECSRKYGRTLTTRIDNFEDSARTNILCGDWRHWKQPIIWFQGANDAVAVQFFLKNIHPGMKTAASALLGNPKSLQSRPNAFGELMRIMISPSQAIQEAINWVLNGADPDIALHMRMLTNRSLRALQAALECVKRALDSYPEQATRPRIALVSDTPSLIKEITPKLTEFAEVIYFNYKSYAGNISGRCMKKEHQSVGFRAKDWGPAPRWVAFVDFFLASRAKHAVISGAHRRVGTTYVQLLAALAAANRHGKDPMSSNFSFFSSFQSNILVNGLADQVGWGHAWNRFAGRLSCHLQPHQCAFTPLLPSGWWDGEWQSPIPRDIHRLQDYGVRMTQDGQVDEASLVSYCRSRKDHVKTMEAFGL